MVLWEHGINGELKGKQFGRLIVLEEAGRNKYKNVLWKCKCRCGKITYQTTHNLVKGLVVSCGCKAREGGNSDTWFKPLPVYINKYDLETYDYGVGYYKDKKFLFDKEDYDLIKDYSWHISDNDYVKSNKKIDGTQLKKTIRMHILVMHSDPKKYEVDHIHHNILDNRKSQLRKILHCENMMNSKLRSDNTTGVKGVYWDKSRNKWLVSITAYKRTYHIGRFDKFEDAVKARQNAEEKYQKNFYNKDLRK